MKTKLEIMVAYLAGRKGAAPDAFRDELEDPASEASRLLEAVRQRSRGVLGAGARVEPDRRPATRHRDAAPIPAPAAARPARLALGITVATLACTAVGAAWWARGDRVRRLEETLTLREDRWDERIVRLEAALARRQAAPRGPAASPHAAAARAADPTARTGPARADERIELALARIGARLGELEQQLAQEASRRDPNDPAVAQLRSEFDELRQAIASEEKLTRQDVQELRATIHEVLRLVRQWATRLRAQEPIQVPIPVPIPVPMHGLEPGSNPGSGSIPGQGQVPGQGLTPAQDLRHPNRGSGARSPGLPKGSR
jgi:hypothetical protein